MSKFCFIFFFSLSVFLCAVEGALGPGMSPSFKLGYVCIHSHLHRQTSMAWPASFPFLCIVPNVSSSLTAIFLPCEITKQLFRNCSFLPFGAFVNSTHKTLSRALYVVGVIHSLLRKKRISFYVLCLFIIGNKLP